MLRNKRVYIFIAVFLFFCGGVWIYVQHQNAAFKSNTYSYISAVNSLKSKQISDWYVDKINNAKLMARNPYIQTFVSQYLAEKNYSKLKKLLSIIAEEHDIVSIFFIDSSFSFESKRITNLQFNYDIKYETIPEQTVHVSDLYYNTDSLIVVDFVAPLFSKSHERLGFLVFQNSVSKTINKTLAQKILTDVSRNTFTNVLFQTDSSLAHYNYAIHKIKQYSQDSFFMSYSVLDSVKKNNLYTGQVSQKNSLFKKQDLFVVHNVKHTNLYIYTVLPADEFYAQQIQSQIYIAIFFTIILLLFVFLFLLKKSNKKQSMYKKMYMLQAQYKTMLYSMGDAVIVTNELGIVQNVNGIAEELIGCTEAKAKHKYIDDLFTI
ncbi:MAG: hypothetical protein GX330_05945, partial [Bacteroidales bacterium]|nr:hypothetical protein [Bacteroidales bacterium]